MTVYAIGDVQGCFDALQKLLNQIQFEENKDTLWFTGDLVNRGMQSLEVLRFVKSLGEKAVTVLGNHDFHLLALAYSVRGAKAGDTLGVILNADDKKELIDWLRRRPLFYHDKKLGFALAHAGIAPMWSIEKAASLAAEVETALQGENAVDILKRLFSNDPAYWNDKLEGIDRLRCIVNYFTRMRFCHADGRLDLEYKGGIKNCPEGLQPWFEIPQRASADTRIIFGHWAALEGKANAENIYALDTGCVWGRCLTAMRLEDGERISVGC